MPVQAPPSGIFRGLGSAKPTQDGNYTRVGHYLAQINTCKIGQNRKNIPFAAIEMTIVKVFDNAANLGHRPGEEVTRFINAGDFFTKDIRQFLCAVAGMTDEAVPDEDAEKAAAFVFGPMQPLTGRVVEWKGTQITLKNGNPFTKCRFWREVKPSEMQTALTAEEIARFFPNGLFQKMLEMEKSGGAPAPASGGMAPPPPPPGPAIPADAPRSPDGNYWWDAPANKWQLIPK